MLNLRNGKKLEVQDEGNIILPIDTLVSDLYAKDVEFGRIYYENGGLGTQYILKEEFKGNGNQNIIPNSTILSALIHFTALPAGGGGGSSITNLGLNTANGTNVGVLNSNGTGFIIASATATDAGVMTAADKTKLDSLTASTGIGTFSPTTAYTTGQLVIQAGKIYQANAATPTGAFNATQWTEISPSAASASVITTQTVTVTGTLTTAQETALVAGFSKNTTTGEVWFKDAAGIVTKIEKENKIQGFCVKSAPTNIAANGTFVFNDNLLATYGVTDLNPTITVYNGNGVVITDAINITTRKVDANNTSVSIGSVAITGVVVVVCTGGSTNLSVINTAPSSNTLSYDTATGILTSTANGAVATATIAAGVWSQDITLAYATGAATAGLSFDTNNNGGITMTLLPTGIATAKVDDTKVIATIHTGTAPATDTNVIVTKNNSQDVITFTIPANANAGVALNSTILPGVTFVNGDKLFVRLSQDMPLLNFGIYFPIIKA